jgi:hypothetical protein
MMAFKLANVTFTQSLFTKNLLIIFTQVFTINQWIVLHY